MCRGLLAPTVLLLAACASGLQTTADWNPEADFTAFQGWGGVGVSTSTTTATTYTDGTLVIGVFAGQSQEVLWHGSGTTRLRENLSPAERTENVNNAVAKILEDFPPTS